MTINVNGADVLIDPDSLHLISGSCSIDSKGYVLVCNGKVRERLHRLVMNAGHGQIVDTPEDAAMAYDVAAREMHGDFAVTNFSVNRDDHGAIGPGCGE